MTAADVVTAPFNLSNEYATFKASFSTFDAQEACSFVNLLIFFIASFILISQAFLFSGAASPFAVI